MTVVVAWRDQGGTLLWVVSDSRISTPGRTAGAVVLTDHAAKVLEISVELFEDGPFGRPAALTTIGLAYAGSSLVALQAYAAVVPLWSRLAAPPGTELPVLEDLARHFAMFLEAYAKEVGGAGGDPRCECLLAAWDPQGAAPCAVLVETSPQDGSASIRPACVDEGVPEILGSDKDEVRRGIAELPPSPDLPFELPSRVPLRYMRSTLKTTDRRDIGGGVQIGMASEAGFELSFDVQPLLPGSPFAELRYRGFDMSEIGRIGNAFVTLRGIA